MPLNRLCIITFDYYLFDPRVRRLAEAAHDGDFQVDVICLRQAREAHYQMYHGIRIYRVPMARGFGRTLARTLMDWCLFLILSSVLVARLHLRRHYSVVHVHNMPDFLVFSALLPKLMGAKVVLDIQDASPELMAVKVKGRLRLLCVALALAQERASIDFADHVVTIGWTLEELLRRRGVPASKLTSIVNSADPKFFPLPQEHAIDTSPFRAERPCVLLYHGTIAERQGLDIAIRAVALASLTVPHLRLQIKGRGEHLPFLKALVDELHTHGSLKSGAVFEISALKRLNFDD